MDFLKSAVASAISKGPPFPYSFGDRVDIDNSIWALHNGTKKEDGSNCSIFAFDVNVNRSRLPLAKNALRKLRTLRHPGVIRVLDTVETDAYIYIATERVTPLSWHVKRSALTPETIKWGLYTAATTLKFINEDASSVHGNVRISSIFTSESGEWKLGGFEVLSSLKEEDPAIYKFGGLLPDSSRYASPEINKGGWDAIKQQPIHATDAYLFGILIYDAFSGGNFMSSDQLTSNTKPIPQNVLQSYRRLIQPNPKSRLSIAHFLAQGVRAGGFFDTALIQVAEFVENMGVKGEAEREEFIRKLDETGDQFPEEFLKMKVLPELLKGVEFGGGGPQVFSLVLKIGERLSGEEWESLISPCVVRLFAIPDRAIRVFLLDNLPKMIDHLSNKVVNDKLFPDIMTGFSDVAPIVREQSVKAVLVIINKLSDRNINGDLLKYLAKTQNDEQPGIRTNTTICLGKIARNLGPNTRQKVLIAAFGRSLRDPFVHARNAALMALAATADVFDEKDIATKLLPAICCSLVDKEKIIRTQAMKTMDIYVARVKSLTASMADTALPPPSASDPVAAGAPRMGTPQTDESWAGWAISSFTKKLSTATGELQPVSNDSGTTIAAPSTIRSNSEPAITKPQPSPATVSSFGANKPLSTSRTEPAFQKSAFHGDDDNEDNDPDAWGELEEENFFDAPTESNSPPPPTTKPKLGGGGFGSFENEEPDFSFLSKPKNPLPKGLAKSTPANKPASTKSPLGVSARTTAATKTPAIPRIGAGNAFANGKSAGVARGPIKTTDMKPVAGAPARKTPAVASKAAVAKKKAEQVPPEVEDIDAWGDDW